MILKLQTKVQRASCLVKSYDLALITEAAASVELSTHTISRLVEPVEFLGIVSSLFPHYILPLGPSRKFFDFFRYVQAKGYKTTTYTNDILRLKIQCSSKLYIEVYRASVSHNG